MTTIKFAKHAPPEVQQAIGQKEHATLELKYLNEEFQGTLKRFAGKTEMPQCDALKESGMLVHRWRLARARFFAADVALRAWDLGDTPETCRQHFDELTQQCYEMKGSDSAVRAFDQSMAGIQRRLFSQSAKELERRDPLVKKIISDVGKKQGRAKSTRREFMGNGVSTALMGGLLGVGGGIALGQATHRADDLSYEQFHKEWLALPTIVGGAGGFAGLALHETIAGPANVTDRQFDMFVDRIGALYETMQRREYGDEGKKLDSTLQEMGAVYKQLDTEFAEHPVGAFALLQDYLGQAFGLVAKQKLHGFGDREATRDTMMALRDQLDERRGTFLMLSEQVGVDPAIPETKKSDLLGAIDRLKGLADDVGDLARQVSARAELLDNKGIRAGR